jgi:hypothetical protein
MNKLAKVCLYILAAVVAVTGLHIWQNVGFDRLTAKWSHGNADTARFKVGFLPVT